MATVTLLQKAEFEASELCRAMHVENQFGGLRQLLRGVGAESRRILVFFVYRAITWLKTVKNQRSNYQYLF